MLGWQKKYMGQSKIQFRWSGQGVNVFIRAVVQRRLGKHHVHGSGRRRSWPTSTWNKISFNVFLIGSSFYQDACSLAPNILLISFYIYYFWVFFALFDFDFFFNQPIENYSEWRLLYFISFILLVGFFVLNMFVGVVVENFHRCREEQEKEERVRRLAKRAKQMEKKRRSEFLKNNITKNKQSKQKIEQFTIFLYRNARTTVL